MRQDQREKLQAHTERLATELATLITQFERQAELRKMAENDAATAQSEATRLRELRAELEAQTAQLQRCRETAVVVAKKLIAARTPEATRIPAEKVR